MGGKHGYSDAPTSRRAFGRFRSLNNWLRQRGDGGVAERANAASVVYIVDLHPFDAGITGSDMTEKVWMTVYGMALMTFIHIKDASSSME